MKKNLSLIVREECDSSLLQRRLGHLNYNSLTMLSQKNMVYRLSTIEKKNGVCEGRMIGKHHRQPFPKEGVRRAKEVLELVHTEVWSHEYLVSCSKHVLYFIH